MRTIIVTGSVGTGKTTLAKKLSKKLKYEYIDVNRLVKEKNISSGYDKKRKCKIIDIQRLNKFLIKVIQHSKNGLIIDSHLSHYLPKKYVDWCIVTKCEINKLSKRLKKRKYGKTKIEENIECEIFDVCLNEAKEAKHNVLVVNTTKGLNIEVIFRKVK